MFKRQLLKYSGVLGVIGISIFLISKSLAVNFTSSQNYQDLIIELQEQDAIFSQNILKSRYELFTSYDDLVNNLVRQKDIQAQLQKVPDFIDRQGRLNIQATLEQRLVLLEQKESLSEWFKSQNALLKNSLRYLPLLASQLESDSEAQPWSNPLKIATNDLLRNILLYNATSSENLTPTIKEQIDDLLEIKKTFQITKKQFPVDLVVSHANIILTQKPQVEELTSQLLSPLSQQNNKLKSVYQQQYQRAISLTNIYRLYTYLWSLFLILLGNYFWLKRNNRKQTTANSNQQVIEGIKTIDKIDSALFKLENNLIAQSNSIDLTKPKNEWNKIVSRIGKVAIDRHRRERELQAKIDKLTERLIEIEHKERLAKNEESFSFLKARLLLITKNKQKLLTPAILSTLKTSVDRTLQEWECQLEEFKGEADKISLLFSYSPRIMLSQLAIALKQESNSILYQEFPSQLPNSKEVKQIWSEAYFIVSCEYTGVDPMVKTDNNLVNLNLSNNN